MFRSQIISGDIRTGGHRYVVVGVNARDNCGSAAKSICEGLRVSITQLKHAARCGDVGGVIRIEAGPATASDHAVTVLGLVLRRDAKLPIRIEDLRSAVEELVRFLRHLDPRAMHTADVGMVAAGTGGGRLLGGFATLLRVLIDEGYPGLVYQPDDPGHRLGEAALRQLGVAGAASDPLPPWRGGAVMEPPPPPIELRPSPFRAHVHTHG